MDLNQVALVLILIGALNWGTIGALEVNVVDRATALVVKDNKMVNRAVYLLVGIAALFVIYTKASKRM